MIVFQNKFFCFINQNPLDIVPPMIFLLTKHVSFMGRRIFGVSLQASHSFLHFTGFHRWTHMYNQKYRFHPRGYLSLLATTRHKFFHVIRPCDSVRHRPTVLNPPIKHQVRCLIISMHSHLFNAMSPCICNVCAIAYLYHVTYMMNAI